MSAPSTVGTAMDQPTIPYIPRPNHAPRPRCRRARLRLAARCAIRLASGSSGGSRSCSDTRFELHQAANEIRLQACHRAAGVPLALVLEQELLLDGAQQRVEVIVDHRAPRRHEDVRAVL